ncbi:MAG: dethiobiotin synthase, partial [Myxococcales bacterium]|nr:dethiobiotin synthase [Myxococcales bacterium]
MTGYFVTGTDTNVGKTFVTCRLATRAVALGQRVFAFKPIESGCVEGADGQLVGADQELLAQAAGGWQHGALRGLYRFPLAAAPLVAAEAAHASIDLELVVRTSHQGAAAGHASLTLVEGAGGWRVPITATTGMADLAAGLGYPVIIVARAGLGTINHTLLTVEAVLRDRCAIAAVVMSRRPDDDPEATQRNRL